MRRGLASAPGLRQGGPINYSCECASGAKRVLRAAIRALLAMSLIGLAGAALADNRVALVIGNSNYAVAPLENPKNDADDVAAALMRLSFKVTALKDLSVRDFDGAIDAFEAAAKDADVALFFFSGHGVQIDKRGYLAPIDVKAETQSGALRELIAIQEVVSRIENVATVSVIVLDACRDSPLQERLRRISADKNKGFIPAKGLPPPSVVGSNTLIVYATVPGETASDGTGRNSPFTTSLLKNIETPGLEIELVFKRVTADVLASTRGKQQPERLSRLQTELMLLPGKPEAKLQALLSEAAQIWPRIEGLTDIEVLDAFRRQYGATNPLYDTLASRRIEELKRDQAAANSPPASSQWPWPSGQRSEAAKPEGTQTTVAVPPKTVPPAEAACDGLVVAVALGTNPCVKPGSGQSFRDCSNCPEMVVVPEGSFTMGSPESEPERESRLRGTESPQHRVQILKPFAVGKFSVTFVEWDACVADDGCNGYKPADRGWGRADRPAINVSWNDAKTYVAWLNKKTGKDYRLLTESEREYVTRAGTTTPFWWGSSITPEQANYDGSYTYAGGRKGEYRQKTVPVKSFQPNPWGLYQVHGNVWEWVEDCWSDNYNGAPRDGSARTAEKCSVRVLRGGSWDINPRYLRAAYRDEGNLAGYRSRNTGLRVARTLYP